MAMATLGDGDVPIFSVAVIGLGLIGSAACRHLSCSLGSSVAGIGPPEPADWSSHTGVFASHYDQARLTRIVDPDPVWSILAARSIASYAEIESQSGISFHHPVGSIRVSPFSDEPTDSLKRSFTVGARNGAVEEWIDDSRLLQDKFPFFQFHNKDVAIMEYGGAGYINPRKLVKAQLAIAAKNGASILQDAVKNIGFVEGGIAIILEGGRVVHAQKVLVSAGSYTSFLLPGKRLDMEIRAVSTVLVEMNSEEAKALQCMPSFIWRLENNPALHSVYGCPPVPYPDGKVYLKIGGDIWVPVHLHTYEEIVNWFHGFGNPEEISAIEGVFKELFPQISANSMEFKPCMVSYTAHGYPYIDAVDGKSEEARVFVATGGCGASAKSSDEIGRIAALLVEQRKWTYDLEASLFRGVFVDDLARAKL